MGTAAGTVSAAQVARMTFDGIRQQRFYLCPYPDAVASARHRFDDIAALRNPRDPFGGNLVMRTKVVATLRGN